MKQEKQILSLFQDSLLQNHFSLQRLKEGKISEITPCINCLQSCMGYMTDPNHLTACCLVNPRVGHEAEYTFKEAEQKKNIMVVGSGRPDFTLRMLQPKEDIR